jgi:hypothetical protein
LVDPRSDLEVQPAELSFSSLIATKSINIQRRIWPYIWSFYEKQIPATRTLLQATSQARGSYSGSYEPDIQKLPSQDIEWFLSPSQGKIKNYTRK